MLDASSAKTERLKSLVCTETQVDCVLFWVRLSMCLVLVDTKTKGIK